MDEFNIGEKLRKARQERKMSMKVLAQEIGCSISLISLIENRKISPPIKTLSCIAKTLGISLKDLFEEDEERVVFEITRKSDGNPQKETCLRGDTMESTGSLRHSLVRNKKMKPQIIKLPKGCPTYLKYLHNEESLVYVIHGKTELFLGNHSIALEEGDSVYFETSSAHGFRSRDNSEALILEVGAAA